MINIKNIIKKVFSFIYEIYQKILNKLLTTTKGYKNILLYCNSTTMETHLVDYYNQIKNIEKIKVYLFYENCNLTKQEKKFKIEEIIKDKNIIPIKNYFIVLLKYFNLVVCADTKLPSLMNKKITPMLYINHGLHIISYDGGENLYTYEEKNSKDEKGKYKFNIMFEPNSRIANEMIAKEQGYKDIIKWVGYKFADDIIKEKNNYKYYREKLGIDEKQIAVLIFGTWNVNSLFHLVGKEIIEQAKKMSKEKYKFILSIHPKEYYKYKENIEPLGQYIESQKENGFIVRNPSEDFIPYLIASDIVISDHSSMYELALIAEKKLILCDIPDEILSKYSIYYQLKKCLPIYKIDSNLEQLIQINLIEEKYKEILKKYREEIVEEKGRYSEKVKYYTEQLLNIKKK